MRTKRRRTFAFLGPRGSGKTATGVALRARAERTEGWYVDYSSSALNEQTSRMDSGRDPVPTPQDPGKTEELLLSNDAGEQRSILFTSGEMLNPDGANDYSKVTRPWLEAHPEIEPVVALHAYIQDQFLSDWSLVELTWFLQHNVGFSFLHAVQLAVDTLRRPRSATEQESKFVTDSKSRPGADLVALCAAWQDIPENCLHSVRLERHPQATLSPVFSDSPGSAFRVLDCSEIEGDIVLRSLLRLARAIHRESRAAKEIVRQVCRDFPTTIVVCTHADLLSYLPGIHRSDLREAGCKLFPVGSSARIDQVVLSASWKLSIRPEPFVPSILKERPSDDGARELLTLLVQDRSISPVRRSPLQRFRKWITDVSVEGNNGVPKSLTKYAP